MREATLYTIPGSHPSRTGELMLQHKGQPYRRVDIPPGLHRMFVRLRGFPGYRVPAVRFGDGSRAQGTRPLARALDERRPEPRLVPDDPRVLEAEAWGEKTLQEWARRVTAAAGARDTKLIHEGGADGRLGTLLAGNLPQRRATCVMVLVAFAVTPKRQRADWARRGEILDRVDAWIADGVLNGEQLNCADFQIVTSLALIDYRLDLRPELQRRPLYRLVERVLPLPARTVSAPDSSSVRVWARKGVTWVVELTLRAGLQPRARCQPKRDRAEARSLRQ